MNKIDNDPEPPEVKQIEKDLWLNIETQARLGRRTGLGITGLGDALAMLNLRYGSDKSIVKTEEIYRALAIGSHSSSVQLAKERGPFEVWDYNKEKNHAYLNQVMTACGDSVMKDWKKYGRRNIANTTTAPVGSVSCLTQTTSGIEPAYLLSYSSTPTVFLK